MHKKCAKSQINTANAYCLAFPLKDRYDVISNCAKKKNGFLKKTIILFHDLLILLSFPRETKLYIVLSPENHILAFYNGITSKKNRQRFFDFMI
ncbi:hypothetical protein BAMA_11545 [Bacillus manliponensis]|uniref:Uncharacterized protein n=1 Tax=Bacillus manliponensis TaxID=574376 RepID=A0A073JU67_9BACI|nr:hypothetical protein BAMA_11545 [Bacillus manliponensis]